MVKVADYSRDTRVRRLRTSPVFYLYYITCNNKTQSILSFCRYDFIFPNQVALASVLFFEKISLQNLSKFVTDYF